MENLKDINYKAFEERTAYDINIQKELINSFKTEAENYRTLLMDFCDSSDTEQLVKTAHKVKSAFGLFGLEKLSYRMKNIEENEIFENIENIKNEIIDIFRNFLKLFNELENYVVSSE